MLHACPCQCPCCMSLSMMYTSMSMMHAHVLVHAACPCPCSISVSMLHVNVNAACPCPCPFCISVSKLHTRVYGPWLCPRCMFMFMLHVCVPVHAACTYIEMPECRTVRHSVSPVPECTELTMPGQVRYQTKWTQSGIFLVRYRTKILDARMPMPALVSWMPMPSYGSIYKTDLLKMWTSECQYSETWGWRSWILCLHLLTPTWLQ